MPYRLNAGAVSDVGAHRKTNQDAAFTAPWGAAVADGVGGGPAGDLASSAFVHRLAAAPFEVLDATHLGVSVRAANWDLRAHVERDPSLRGMATTFTGIFLSRGGGLLLAHAGDSRAYLLHDGILTQQTRDDSYVQALVDSGLVAPEDAISHPRRNMITASLSGGERDRVMVKALEPVAGDRWMLCSDGLSDYVPHDAIASVLCAHPDPAAAAEAAVVLALEAASLDNVTVVVCDVGWSQDAATPQQARFHGAAAARFNEALETA